MGRHEKNLIYVPAILAFGLLLGCQKKPVDSSAPSPSLSTVSPQDSSSPLADRSKPTERLFDRLSAERTKIHLHHRFPPEAPFDMMSDQYSGSGVCIGDVDGDDLPDVYITNYDQGNRLYRNLGDLRFQDVTQHANVTGEGRWCAGCSFADLDSDGDLDLYVCASNAPNLLYENDGQGNFREVAKEYGLDYSGASVMMTFADYDRDGDLDGYLVTHRLKVGDRHRLPRSTSDAFAKGIIKRDATAGAVVTSEFRELFQLIDKSPGRKDLMIAGQRDYLFRNEGKKKFKVANQIAGIRGYGIGLAASWWDFDSDGWLDLYVSNDYKGADQLYRNNRDGTFTDVVRTTLPHVPWFSMGSDQADINNDGLIDFLATDMAGTSHYSQKLSMGDMEKDRWFLESANPQQYMRNAVYLNTRSNRLWEVAQMTGLANTDWTWSPKFADFNNDGRSDLFVTNGMSRDFMNSDLIAKIKSSRGSGWEELPILKQANLAFQNLGDLRFQDVSEAWGLDQMAASYGAAVADLDRDGDLDLVVTNFEEPVSVFRNNGQSGGSLLLRLQDRRGAIAMGAQVSLRTSVGRQVRQLTSSQGFMSANEPMLHFGLGSAPFAEQVEIVWPDGSRQAYKRLEANRLYKIHQPDTTSKDSRPWKQETWFKPAFRFPELRHEENEYDDYRRQPLLPASLSRLGPGMAIGDVDSDGVTDYYLSAASGKSGQLMVGRTSTRVSTAPFVGEMANEDLGALFFDCDSDGDDDLYVVSGGYETEPNSPLLQDRIYLNDGQGSFHKSSDRLPRVFESGSCVAAADYDRDGDLDLFVGSRMTPGKYPLPPNNQLLRNDGGRFKNVIREQADGLEQTGMVTSAIWSDIDDDGWNDLLLAHEWGTISCFRNIRGTLEDATEEVGLAKWIGWWNGISAGDFDCDGDIDFVVTNLGENTKYHASVEHPLRIFYGDFDGTGRNRIVESSFEDGTLFPARGKSCSTSAMPALSHRFPTFEKFALASLEEVYTKDRLEGSFQLTANTLQSGILINQGGAFEFSALPRLVQSSPTYGSTVADMDGDGVIDLYLVQNSYSPQPETGRFDGGMSLLLKGRGDGTFHVVPPVQSGLIVPHDASSVSTVDLNQDRRPDLVVGINNGRVLAFENDFSTQNQWVRIRLRGRKGNLHGVGARITITLTNGQTQTAEIYAGSGYLSQTDSSLLLGIGTSEIESIQVRWPEGEATSYSSPSGSEITLTRSKSERL